MMEIEQEHIQEALPVRMRKHFKGLPVWKKLEAGLYLMILIAALGYFINGIAGLRQARMSLHDETQQSQFDVPLVELDRDQTYLLVAHANW